MAEVNQPAPNLEVAEWVQGAPSNIDQERGKVILIEVIQVNCPGCFISALPEAIEVYTKHKDHPLTVWVLATAFEDFGLNTLENLKKLVKTGEVVGQTQAHLMEQNILRFGKLPYRLPFPVAWDKLVKRDGTVGKDEIENWVRRDFPNFESLPDATRSAVRSEISNYLAKKKFDARTFDTMGLRGTPSTLLIDKAGVLRHKLFGSGFDLMSLVENLLNE